MGVTFGEFMELVIGVLSRDGRLWLGGVGRVARMQKVVHAYGRISAFDDGDGFDVVGVQR